MLENGNAAYPIELPNLEPMLETSTFLMDRITFHAVHEDGYRKMATTNRLLYLWQNGQPIAELNKTQLQFGLPPKPEASPARQPAANQHLPQLVIQTSQSQNQETADDDEAVPDLMDEPLQPRAVVYLELSFSLERPVHRLKMDERLEVHNNYILAISNKMHKIDLVNRLKKNEPHNAAHYQRQSEQQLVQLDDVIHMDDYLRRTEDLPMIEPLVAYEEVEKFPELFDAKRAVSRISTGVDILERQIHQPGMYPNFQSAVPTTSCFVPHRPTSTFKSINPAAPSPAPGSTQQGSFNSLLNMVDSTQDGSLSSGSSIPCAQRSPANKQSSPASTHQGTPTHSQSIPPNHQAPHQQNATNQQEFASSQANT